MVGTKCHYLETHYLIDGWETDYGDSILLGQEVADELLEHLRYDAQSFHKSMGIPEDKVKFDFEELTHGWAIRVMELGRLRYSLCIEEPINGVYVSDEEEEGGEL